MARLCVGVLYRRCHAEKLLLYATSYMNHFFCSLYLSPFILTSHHVHDLRICQAMCSAYDFRVHASPSIFSVKSHRYTHIRWLSAGRTEQFSFLHSYFLSDEDRMCACVYTRATHGRSRHNGGKHISTPRYH